MLQHYQVAFQEGGDFRSAQVTARVTPEQGLELVAELVEKAQEIEDPAEDPLVITVFLHPPTSR